MYLQTVAHTHTHTHTHTSMCTHATMRSTGRCEADCIVGTSKVPTPALLLVDYQLMTSRRLRNALLFYNTNIMANNAKDGIAPSAY